MQVVANVISLYMASGHSLYINVNLDECVQLNMFNLASTPPECILSKAGFVVRKTRSSLLPDSEDKLLCLSHNMRSDGESGTA